MTAGVPKHRVSKLGHGHLPAIHPYPLSKPAASTCTTDSVRHRSKFVLVGERYISLKWPSGTCCSRAAEAIELLVAVPSQCHCAISKA